MSLEAGIIVKFREGEKDWVSKEFKQKNITIGRGEDCDLVLNKPEVSRHHAQITWDGRDAWIADLGSTNRTIIAKVPLTPNHKHPVEFGQNIEIGPFTIAIYRKEESATAIQPKEEIKVSPEYCLKYRKGASAWVSTPLPGGEFIIGRSNDCNLRLDDHQVSRRHARINLEQGGIFLFDLGSTNGTQVNGDPLPPRRPFKLQLRQLFSVGDFTLYVEEAGSEEPPPQPVSDLKATMMAAGAPALEAGNAGIIQTMLDTGESIIPTRIRTLDLKEFDRITIGRAADNNLVVNHPLLSRYHAVIERSGTRYRLRDLHSTNGVYVNGNRIDREAWLKDRDEVRIGPYIFILSKHTLQEQTTPGIRLDARGINQFVSKDLNLLKNISLTIKPMEFVALVGMSGSGKTTLMNALSGFKPASHGIVLANGINFYEHYDLFRNDIGYVPQRDIVHMELTPFAALDYVAQLRMPPDTSSTERQTAVLNVLRELDLEERKDVPISQLSGGQLKRVSIGVELLTKPRLFFLDEPTSGLDPGTEYDMMKLMRRLADQGRTIILITHATKNVMLCDKVIFLTRGGNLAFFGPPEDALAYFDAYRSPRDHREKEMEFDDIYRILNDPSKGTPEQWRERYLASRYARSVATRDGQQARKAALIAQTAKFQESPPRVSALRQFRILSSRNIRILLQDKISLALMLAIAPGLGVLDFIWGSNLYDPVVGDSSKIISMWFMTALVTVLIGALSSVREIVKEVDIYKRERAVNLKIVPYISSKVWVGVVLALYQSAVLLAFRLAFVHLNLPNSGAILALFITMVLSTLCGYLIGLGISATAPNQNAALIMTIAALVPQFLFSGALLPLNLIPGGEVISVFMPTRWAFEALTKTTGLGDKLISDPCWTGFPKQDRLQLPEALKADCPCLGASIFTACSDFPGILSPDFYGEAAQTALKQPRPEEPLQPTAIPYPTAIPSPTPLPTPTPLPSPTPLPTPADPRAMADYMAAQRQQGQEYQDSIMAQFEQYRLDSQAQGAEYSKIRTEQGDEYAQLRQQQGDEYTKAMQAYGDARATWQENREKAINSAEALMGSIYDDFGRVITGSLTRRWTAMLLIITGLLGIIFFFQKRKDVV